MRSSFKLANKSEFDTFNWVMVLGRNHFVCYASK